MISYRSLLYNTTVLYDYVMRITIARGLVLHPLLIIIVIHLKCLKMSQLLSSRVIKAGQLDLYNRINLLTRAKERVGLWGCS